MNRPRFQPRNAPCSTATATVMMTLALLLPVWHTRVVLASDPAALSPQTTFFHANALYKDGQYGAAAAEYEKLLATGLESGNVYFNLGNAYFKAGETGKAILNYERAQRLIPNDPDLRANLAYAQSLTDAAPCTPAFWQRLVFPLAQRLPTRQLVWLASLWYTLLILTLIAHQMWARRPRWLLYLSGALGAALLITATSLGEQLTTVEWPRHAVVVSSGDTPARFEPATSGTLHFVLKQGALVSVLDARQGWLQVARCDGRRGWVEQSALEEL